MGGNLEYKIIINAKGVTEMIIAYWNVENIITRTFVQDVECESRWIVPGTLDCDGDYIG